MQLQTLKKNRFKRVLLTGVTLIYAVVAFGWHWFIGPNAGVLLIVVVPVVLAGWLYGVPGGILAGLLAAPVNMALLWLAGAENWFISPLTPRSLNYLFLLVVGGIVGYLRTQHLLLKQSLAQRLEIEAALKVAQNELEARVAERTAELSEANQQLSQNETRYRQLVEISPNAITIYQNGQIIYVNQAGLDMVQATIDQVFRADPLQFIAPEDRDAVAAALDTALQQDNMQGFADYNLLQTNGTVIPVELAIIPLRLDGQPALQLILRDLTQLKKDKRMLQRRNRELALYNKLIAASIGDTDTKSILNTACRELGQLFKSTETLGLTFNRRKTEIMVNAEHQRDPTRTRLGIHIKLARHPHFETLLDHLAPIVSSDAQSDPRFKSLQRVLRRYNINSLLLIPLVINGEPVGALALLFNAFRHIKPPEVSLAQRVGDQVAVVITQARLSQTNQHLQEQYRQAQKMEAIGLLAGGIAHDFNNLLTAINGFAELLLARLPEDGKNHPLAQRILSAGTKAADLTSQLLAFSRKQVIKPQIINYNDAINDLKEILEHTIGSHIDQQFELASNLHPIKMDPSQIEQILLNLIVNAQDAMPNGGTLTTSTQNATITEDDDAHLTRHLPPGDYAVIRISDTGEGMSQETVDRIFEPFFTTKDLGKGTGLGLATVFGIIKQNHGDIHVTSQLGQGSTFSIYFPKAMPKKKSQDAQQDPALKLLPTGHETILLVEDNPVVRELARHVLTKQGYHILEAANGAEALTLLAKNQSEFDLLVTDVVMPRMNGDILANKLRLQHPDLKIIFISGYNEGIKNKEALNEHAAYLGKPFSPAELTRTVRQVLDRE